MREVDLFDEAVEHHVAPAMPSFFEDFWREAEQRQRRAARRWRALALGLAAVAAGAVSAAGVLASSRSAAAVVDQTWSCVPAQVATGPTIGIHASVRTPRSEPYFHLTMQQPPEPAQLGPSAVHFDASSSTVQWDTQHCRRVHSALVFGPHGLPADNVYTTHFLGNFLGTCRTAAHVLVRANVVFKHGRPSSGRVLIVDAPTQRAVFYAQWSPTRIADWERSTCDVGPW